MRFFFLLLLSIITAFPLTAQVNYWYDLFSVNRLFHIASIENTVYAAGKNALLIYQTDNGSIDRLSAQGELSDTSISAIASIGKDLVIGYTSGNIDILRNRQVYNLPDIRDNRLLSSSQKKIYKIIAYSHYAFLATDFGVAQIDMDNNIIKQTIFFTNGYSYIPVKDMIILNNVIYALTPEGIYFVPMEANFSDFQNWNFVNFSTGSQFSTDGHDVYVSAFQFGNTIVFKFKNSAFEQMCSASGEYKFKILDSNIYLFGNKILKYSVSGVLQDSITRYNDNKPIYANDLDIIDGRMWIADRFRGLLGDLHQTVVFPTPFSDNVNYVLPYKDKVFILHKTDETDHQYGYKAVISIITNQREAEYLSFNEVNDFLVMVIDQANSNHWFLSSDSVGLVEILDNQIVNVYNSNNAPFTPTGGYLKITDMKFDESGNLWMIYKSSTYPVIKLNRDGTWENVEASSVAANQTTDRFILTSQNFLYADMLDKGMLAINLSTDESRLFYPSYRIGKKINTIAEDKDQVLWFSTNDGLGYLTKQNFTESGFKAVRPKVDVTLNDTVIYAYLLDNINCIRMLVDAGNRKWVAASYFGVFELEADGLNEIAHFNVNNGKLVTDAFFDVSYDASTGEIYFLSDQGVLVYKSDAYSPEADFSAVKVYPNPVRPNYSGPIVIKGLMRNTIVKITDIEGNIVYETRSNGGMAVWNGLTLDGRMPHSGVYLILCADDKGVDKCVKKLLIIR